MSAGGQKNINKEELSFPKISRNIYAEIQEIFTFTAKSHQEKFKERNPKIIISLI